MAFHLTRRLLSAPNPHLSAAANAAALLAPFLSCKRRRKILKKNSSPRFAPITTTTPRLPHFESILVRDRHFRFLLRSKSHLPLVPGCSLPLSLAGKLHRQLGFPRGRKLSRYTRCHPLLFHVSLTHLSFTPLMHHLLKQESALMDQMLPTRITTVRKLLMISAHHRIPLAKLYHCRLLFGLPADFRDRVRNYPQYFSVTIDSDGRDILELVNYDPALAVSVLEREFMTDEHRVRRTFTFPIKHQRALYSNEEEGRRVDEAMTLPLVSPYADGTGLDAWTVEAEKYRVGVVHEFLNLTLEKRAMIHQIVEFKEEFSLTQHTYQMLLKQPRAFYLAGTEMNWCVFLRDKYTRDGELIEKDPQVVFDEKVRRLAMMTEKDAKEGGIDLDGGVE